MDRTNLRLRREPVPILQGIEAHTAGRDSAAGIVLDRFWMPKSQVFQLGIPPRKKKQQELTHDPKHKNWGLTPKKEKQQ